MHWDERRGSELSLPQEEEDHEELRCKQDPSGEDTGPSGMWPQGMLIMGSSALGLRGRKKTRHKTPRAWFGEAKRPWQR